MRFTDLLLLFCCTLFIFACKTDQKQTVSQQYILSNYYLRYLQPEQELKAEASFRQGDSIQSAGIKIFSDVFFGEEKMTFKKISDVNQRYILKARKAFPEGDITFSFINDEGQKETQSFEMSIMKNLKAEGPISKSKGASISWDGEPLESQESVICIFNDPSNRSTSLVINGPSQSSKINIPPNKLSALTAGSGEVYLVRKKRIRQTTEKRVSLAIMEYYTESITINVEE